MEKTDTIKVALVQQICSEKVSANLDSCIAGIKEAAENQASLVVLQELHNTLYFCQTENPDFFDYAETIPGPSTETLSALSKSLGIVIVASLFEKRAPGIYHNTAVVFDNGTIAGKYRKMHIPDDPGFYEKFYFTPGDLGFTPIKTSVGNLGVLVCWDQWYPEASRLMALSGADILIYPTAIGWDPADDPDEQQRQLEAWMTIQRSHSIANGLPVISCNRTGHEKDPGEQTRGIDFWGNSFITGPQGEILTRAPVDEEIVLVTELDLKRNEKVRRIWPFLRDRRIDAYGHLTKRFID